MDDWLDGFIKLCALMLTLGLAKACSDGAVIIINALIAWF